MNPGSESVSPGPEGDLEARVVAMEAQLSRIAQDLDALMLELIGAHLPGRENSSRWGSR